jgi:hypothetical protein
MCKSHLNLRIPRNTSRTKISSRTNAEGATNTKARFDFSYGDKPLLTSQDKRMLIEVPFSLYVTSLVHCAIVKGFPFAAHDNMNKKGQGISDLIKDISCDSIASRTGSFPLLREDMENNRSNKTNS